MHGSVLFSFLIRLTRGDPHKAEDILQETLIRAWRHPEARGPDGTWSPPWLFTVARRIAIDHLRASQIRPAELSDDRIHERVPADDGIERLIDAGEVRAALRSLPDRLRHVLIEVYLRERSVAEAAAVLNVPPGTVKSRTFYALAALRDALLARGFTGQAGEDAVHPPRP
jgi:RNA polymerase sigma-70 factor, ECF subfamily